MALPTASDNRYRKVILVEQDPVTPADVSTPGANDWAIFMGDDGELYVMDDGGSITQLSGGGGTVTETDLDFSDITTANASTTEHGLLLKATAPASGLRNVVAIDNGETVYKNTALFDTTNPAAVGSAAAGTSLIAARRDHVHAADSDDVAYAATTVADWDGGTDPGDVEQALDQLAERVTDLEAGGSGTVGDLLDFVFVRKTVNEDVTSNTTLQDDDALTFAVGASQVWEFEFVIFHQGNASGDIKFAVLAPTGTTGHWGMHGWPGGSSNGSPTASRVARSNWDGSLAAASGTATDAGQPVPVLIKGLAIMDSTSGSITLQWAQSSSNGTATTVLANSYLIARRVA